MQLQNKDSETSINYTAHVYIASKGLESSHFVLGDKTFLCLLQGPVIVQKPMDINNRVFLFILNVVNIYEDVLIVKVLMIFLNEIIKLKLLSIFNYKYG